MRLLSYISPLVFAGLAACTVTPDAAMKITRDNTPDVVLVGSFEGALALVQGDTSKATISATNGSLTCRGQSTTGAFETDLVVSNKISHSFAMQCSDGRTGIVPATITVRGGSLQVTGGGIGTLSDGSILRVVFGDVSALAAF